MNIGWQKTVVWVGLKEQENVNKRESNEEGEKRKHVCAGIRKSKNKTLAEKCEQRNERIDPRKAERRRKVLREGT